jgi:hypothetical protein
MKSNILSASKIAEWEAWRESYRAKRDHYLSVVGDWDLYDLMPIPDEEGNAKNGMSVGMYLYPAIIKFRHVMMNERDWWDRLKASKLDIQHLYDE